MTIEERLVAGDLNESVHAAKFLWKTHCLAEVMGNLSVSKEGQLLMALAGPVIFFRPEDINLLELEAEIMLEGKLGNGLKLRGRPRNQHGLFDLIAGTKAGVVEFSELEITGTSSNSARKRVFGYVDEFPSEILQIPVINTKSTVAKSFELESDLVLMKGEQRTSGNFLEIFPKTEAADPELMMEAAIYTLSMLGGRRINWRCMTTELNNEVTTLLRSQNQRTHNFYSPIYLCKLAQANEVFKLTHAFLCKTPETMIARMIGMLWDYSGSDFDVRALVLGVAIEGIANEIYDTKPLPPDNDVEIFKARVIERLKEIETSSSDTAEIDDLKRVIGIVKRFDSPPAKKRIAGAAHAVDCNVSKEELDAWFHIRNKRSHGNFGWTFASDNDWLLYLNCVDLFNKLWLGAVKYKKWDKMREWKKPFKSRLEYESKQKRHILHG